METGRIIEDNPDDVYRGLAVDHALLLCHDGGVTLRLWRNEFSVVIGRGQTLAEVDEDYCRQNGIHVCRRISGGGAVYQDSGNLNISLVYPRLALMKPHDVREATRLLPSIILDSLTRCGVTRSTLDDLNGIHRDGYKVSGAASYLNRDTILSHSTLLLSADIKKLEKSLLHPMEVHRASMYSPTANLDIDFENWKPILVGLVEERFDTSLNEGKLTTEEASLTAELSRAYSSEEWVRSGIMPTLKKGII